jgi:hypothetical protein
MTSFAASKVDPLSRRGMKGADDAVLPLPRCATLLRKAKNSRAPDPPCLIQIKVCPNPALQIVLRSQCPG